MIEIYDLPAISLTAEPINKSAFKVTVVYAERPLTGIEMDSLSRTLSSCHMLAAEIKRLEAENSEQSEKISALREELRGEKIRNKEKAESNAQKGTDIAHLRARIALLEAALKLPEGCDVFDLERAQKEGAVDKFGRIWNFIAQEGSGYLFQFQQYHRAFTKEGLILGSEHVTDLRLYCIKEGGK